MIDPDAELNALREKWVAGRTIDDYILEQPCHVCHAAVAQPCTIRGVVNPRNPNEDSFVEPDDLDAQRFLYHAKRTDVGVWHWNVDHSALDQGEHDRWHQRPY